MKENHLLKPLFLLSVLLLLVNDFYFKFEFHNSVTGKLSDFAGLFAFPFFFSCLFVKRAKLIYILTGIFFVFWKSSLSQPIFDFANSYGIGINRVVDYSDLMALLIIPLSYFYWNNSSSYQNKSKRILKPIIIGVCCFSFIATSLAEHYEEVNLSSDFQTQISKDLETVKKQLKIYDYNEIPVGLYKVEIKERDAEIHTEVSLRKIDSLNTQISLDSIVGFKVQGSGFLFYSGIDEDDVDYMQSLSQAEMEKMFEKSINKEFVEK